MFYVYLSYEKKHVGLYSMMMHIMLFLVCFGGVSLIYVMSDIHGCYRQFKQALELIGFSNEDTLYVLGDVIDRGPSSIELLNYMMMFDNIIPLIGNHEVMAMSLLPKLCTEITEDNYDSTLTENDLYSLEHWMNDGGDATLTQFQKLERDEMEMILDYLNEFSLIEEVKVNDKNYVLVHAGLLRNDLRLDLLRVEECVFASTPLILANRTIVCGHTPTSSGCIEFSQGQIHIDCGCVFNGQLGVLCLDTLQTFYVN